MQTPIRARAAHYILVSFLLASASLAPPLHAQDGAFLIDQSCVDTGCFPGDEPGFPVRLGQPGTYRLTSDLWVTEPGVTAIFTPASTMTIVVDLGGHKIRGPYECSGLIPPDCLSHGGIGIFSGAAQMTVRNGTIQDFGRNAILSSKRLFASELFVFYIGENAIEGQTVQARDLHIYGVRGDAIHANIAEIRDSIIEYVRGDGVEVGLVGQVRDVLFYGTGMPVNCPGPGNCS